MPHVIVFTADVVSACERRLFGSEEHNYDILQMVKTIVDNAAQHDNNQVVSYEDLVWFDAPPFYCEQDQEIYRDAWLSLRSDIIDRFRKCHLYHYGHLPYNFDRLHCMDIVLAPKAELCQFETVSPYVSQNRLFTPSHPMRI